MKSFYFSCSDCKYGIQSDVPIWAKCIHPAVEQMKFEGKTFPEFTQEDYEKLETLVNDILHLNVVVMSNEVPNFEWPFKYESTWINGCDGFTKKEQIPDKFYFWNSKEKENKK